MIVKLRCVSNIDMWGEISDYLTVGKIYHGDQVGALVFSLNDDGDELIIKPHECAHGKWEVVN